MKTLQRKKGFKLLKVNRHSYLSREQQKRQIEDEFSAKRIPVHELKLGDIVNRIILFDGTVYHPHFERHEVTMIHWNKGVSIWSDYYRL